MVRNKIASFVLLLLIGQAVLAQGDLLIQGSTPNLHLLHTVAAKETWYSISRMYNLPPKDIAAYNKLTIDKSLEIGQRVQVPLTPANFSQNDAKASSEVFVPLYHIVQDKEWMYRISVNHNKVPIENLEKWNSITKDQAKAGMKLIVGYLKVKESNAALATKSASAAASAPEKTAVVKNEPAPKKEITAAVGEGSARPVSTSEASTRPAPVRETSATKPAPASETSARPAPAINTAKQGSAGSPGGYFKPQFDESGKNTSGLSGTFRSTSGWKDGKYYALMNNVGVGTIVKVNYPQTNKTIYAKVLGELPDMKESSGLELRISDAAANELGAVNSKFSVDVKD